jgi:hypothetical protein
MTGLIASAGLSKLIPLVSGVAGYLVVGAAGAAAATWVTSRGYEASIARLEARQAQATADSYKEGLDTFIKDSAAVHEAAKIFQTQQSTFQENLRAINEAFDAAVAADPLPADCKPTAARMRSISAAIAAVNNSIAGDRPGEAMSAAPRPHR